jgi:large subunit ribosomal protein L5e
MPFVKVVKNKAYFRRFQVKFRRRREGKTDYRQRHKLITQDKNKYNSHKYRLVVRFTNRYVLCQVIYSEIDGDKVFCEASSRELARYGLPVGLKNYAAAYATGLLLARRLLKKVGLDEIYSGVEDVEGTPISTKHGKKTYYVTEVDEDKKPFRALLDVGIKNTTTGAKVFGAMKGASDGGLDIPHSEKRFPGYTRDTKDFDAEVHKSRIMGEHVADYMRELEEDDEEMYQKHFSKYIENDIDADGLEEVLEKVHEAIRANPERVSGEKFTAIDKSFKKPSKLSLAERKARSSAKKAQLKAKLAGDDEEEEEEEDA